MCWSILICLIVIAVSIASIVEGASSFKECTRKEAATDGRFVCLPSCDENHLAYDTYHYCLNYFPNDGNCYMKPYEREDMMTCNGNFGPSDPPQWLIFIGGSNNYFMVKVVLDKMLELTLADTYNPQLYWNATGDLYSEIAIMDFVWDADHNILRKTAWWWDPACYYCLPSTTEEIFLDVPPATLGSFRLSYANIHTADEFTNRMDLVVSAGSDWLSLNPSIDVYMEWTGQWGDYYADQYLHAANLQYLQDRHENENINIRSFVMSDSAGDCGSGAYDNVGEIMLAFENTATDYPKHYFSKRNMMYDESQLSGLCMSNGHTLEPLNAVIAQRYFNIICNAEEPAVVYEATIPACTDFGGHEDECFYSPGGLLGNLYYVCPITHLSVANVASNDYCAATDVAEESTTPFPVCPGLSSASVVPSTPSSVNRDVMGFDGFVYAISALCLLFILVESVRSIEVPKDALEPGVRVKSMAELINKYTSDNLERNMQSITPKESTGSIELATMKNTNAPGSLSSLPKYAPVREVKRTDSVIAMLSNNTSLGAPALAAPVIVSATPTANSTPVDAEQKDDSEAPDLPLYTSSEQVDEVSMVDIESNGGALTKEVAPVAVGVEEDVAAVPTDDTAPSSYEILLAKLQIWFSFPAVATSDRFEAIGFARYLASVHIVLGHMYQASNLGTFHNFNKFGYTWVPWFFMLSGYILTFAERKRRAKSGAKASATKQTSEATAAVAAIGEVTAQNGDKSSPKMDAKPHTLSSIVEYVNHRLETLYPVYLIGICASIATVWAVQGAKELPLPSEVLLYFCLLQGWVPSILEKGLVYLVQCWFLSCLMFYWFVFCYLFDFIQALSDRWVVIVATTASVVIPFVYQMITFSIADWSASHGYLGISSGVDVAVVVIKFHPLSYVHLFVLGCCLPRVRELILKVPDIENVVPFVCGVCYAILIAIFCTAGDEVPGYALSFRIGLFSIVQSALLIGLCNGQDLLTRLFCHPLLKQFGLYGFPQYIFQFIVYAWYSFATQKDAVDIRYFLLLFATSVVVWTLVSPFGGKRMNTFVLCFVPFLVIYLMLQPFWANYHESNGSGSSDSSSSAAVYNPVQPAWWDDSPIDVSVTNNAFLDGYSAARRVFNPSVLFDGGRALFVARRDYQTGGGNNWFDRDYLQNKWESQIIMGTYSASAQTQQASVLNTETFTPCLPPVTCNGNGTLAVKVSAGPEDPRLFYFAGSYYVSVFSYDNIHKNTSLVEDVGYGDYGTGSSLCVPSSDGLIGRMYVAKVGAVNVNPCILSTFKPVLQTGLSFSNYSIVKNWLAFSFNNESDPEELYFIHQISPFFVIMAAELSPDAVNTYVAHNTTAPDLIRLLDLAAASHRAEDDFTLVQQDSASVVYLSAQQLAHQADPASGVDVEVLADPRQGATAVHGSVNPVLIEAADSSTGSSYYLSIFHLVSGRPLLNYASYAFAFCAHPPFEISAVSPRLWLNTTLSSSTNTTVCGAAPFAFVSGLTTTVCDDSTDESADTCLLISYGVCDTESRVAQVRLKEFENTFNITAIC